MRIVFFILVLLFAGVNELYAQCEEAAVCEMTKNMSPFDILEKCPQAGPTIVKCKKGTETALQDLPSPEFVDNGDGTVTDKANKLIWLKKGGATRVGEDIAKPKSLKDAKAFAAGFRLGEKSGWRLPTLPELKTLLVGEKTNNASGQKAWINPLFDDGRGYHYWTTTTCSEVNFIEDRYQKKICQAGDGAVWLVHFNIGAIFWHTVDAEIYNTWLVKKAE